MNLGHRLLDDITADDLEPIVIGPREQVVDRRGLARRGCRA
jgi:hypothetical protein